MPVAALVAAAGTASASTSTSTNASTGAVPPAGKIKHVIVIFQENRSFDEVLGAYCVQHHGGATVRSVR